MVPGNVFAYAHKIADAECGQDFSNSFRHSISLIYAKIAFLFEKLKIGDALDYFLIWRYISRVSIVFGFCCK